MTLKDPRVQLASGFGFQKGIQFRRDPVGFVGALPEPLCQPFVPSLSGGHAPA
jgi:hypothetical protein